MTMPVLRRGSRGSSVTKLQTALIRKAQSDELDMVGKAFPSGKIFETDGIFCGITRQAVRAFQSWHQDRDPEFDVDGIVGKQTWSALGFGNGSPGKTPPAAPKQPNAGQGRKPGQPKPKAGGAGRILPPEGQEMPPWIAQAWKEKEMGVKESYGGAKNHPRILQYIRQSGYTLKVGFDDNPDHANVKRILAAAEKADARREKNGKDAIWESSFAGKTLGDVDETPWCGYFVQWCMSAAGYGKHKYFGSAKAWKTFGTQIGTSPSEGKYGAICVIRHYDKSRTPSGYHVGFFLEALPNGVRMLGGNQNNRVKVSDYKNKAGYWLMWPHELGGG